LRVKQVASAGRTQSVIDMVCHSRSADVTFGRGPSLMSRGPIDLHSVRMAFLWCCDNVSGVANQSDNTPSVLGPANKGRIRVTDPSVARRLGVIGTLLPLHRPEIKLHCGPLIPGGLPTTHFSAPAEQIRRETGRIIDSQINPTGGALLAHHPWSFHGDQHTNRCRKLRSGIGRRPCFPILVF
jgi:hypothetical protein